MVNQKSKAQLSLELEQAQKRIAELEQAAKARTSSKSAEQDRREDEALYRTFIEHTNDGIVILDEQGGVSVWNSAQESIMGIPRKEVIGQKYWDAQYRVSTPETRAKLSLENIKDAFQNTFKTGEHPDLGKLREIEIQLEDGKRKIIQISPFTVKTEDGYRIGSITRDITEQRRAADVSRENEERFVHVFHASPSQMAITDISTGKYMDVNQSFLQSLGFTREEVIDKTAAELNIFVDPSRRASLIEKMKEQGYLRGEDVRVRTKTGDLRHGVFSGEYIQMQEHTFLLTVMNDITERKLAEDAVLETRRRLLEAQELAHIGNWEWDLKEQTLNWSDEVYSIFGINPAGFTPTIEVFENAIHPEDKEDFFSHRARMLEKKQKVNIDHRIILPDGQVRHVQERTQLMLDTNGTPIRVMGTVQDITERKLAEESIRKSTQILNESQAIANLGSWTADLRTGVFDATLEGARLVGWTPGLHSSDELMDIIHPDDKEFMQASWEAAMHGAPYDIEHRIILHGETRWLHITAKVTFDKNGAPLSALGVTQDITDRKKAEEERRESDDRYRLLFETMVQGVVFQDIEGRIIHANPSAERILGLTLDQMQGRGSIDPRWKTIHEDGTPYPGELHPAMTALRSGISVRNSVLGVYSPVHDSYRWLNVNAVPRFRNGDDRPYQVYTTFEDITERKQAENALISSEKKLQTLIDSQTHFVLRINLEGKYTFWNQKFEREFGWRYKEKGIKNASPLDTIESYHHERVLEVVKNCIEQPGIVFSIELDKPAEDRSVRTTLWEFMCLTDEHNQPSEIQCMGVEITDRKKAEEALRESEGMYRLLAENISDVIWIMDIESSRFSYASPSILQLRGYTVDEVLAQDVSASLMPASGQYMAQIMPERLVEFEQGIIKAYTDEIEQPCKDGTTVWTESTTRFVKNPETGKLEVYGVSRNITDRKKAEAAIRLIEKRNTALIEHAPDGIALVDADGVFMFASPSAYRMFGYSPEEIVGIQSREKVHPQDAYLVADLKGKLLNTPEVPQTIEYRFLHKDGSYHWLESTYTNMFDDPSIEGIVINFRDITDRKLAAEITHQQSEQLRLLYEASQQLNRTLDVKEIYQTICDFMTIIAPSDTLFISAFDPDAQLITCKAYWMQNNWLDVSPFPAIPLEEKGKGTQSRVIHSGQAMLLNDYQAFLKTSQNVYYVDDETNEITNEGPEEDEEDVTRSAMIVPLKSGGSVKGIIQVSSYHPNAYTENQLKMLEALSLHIASAEQNALLYTQLLNELNERKQVEEALRTSNDMAQAILNAATESVFLIEIDGTVIAANETTAARLGKRVEDLIGANTYVFLPPEIAEQRKIRVASVVSDRKPLIFEDERLGICLENSLYPIFDNDGKIRRIAIYGRDITDRKKMEAALRASEEKYRVLIKSLDNVVVSLDEQGKVLYINDMAAEQLDSVAEDLIGKNMQDLFPEAFVSEQMKAVQQVIKEDKGVIFETIIMIQGEPRWYRASVQPIHDEDGRVVQVLVNSTDIHDLKTTQQELQELNRTLEERVKQRSAEVQDLYDNAPSGYHSLDANGNIILINETELKWLGYSREEIIGHSIMNFQSPASIAIFKSNFPSFKQHGWIKDLELEFIRKNGTILPVLINATVIYDENRNYILSRSTVMDNTEHKAADEALRNANLEMARAMRMKDEFLASMSHELRTPLNGILGLSEALQLDVYGPLNEKQKSTLGHVEDSGRHLLELINDILDVSKIEAGKFELEMNTCSLGELCQSSIHLTKGMAGKKRQNVNFTMSPASITINADARRLKQVLVNLLSNAVKFTPESGSLGLEVTENESENIVYISVWDNGIGISPDDIKKLFQPFVQLDSSLSRQQTGTGLGLTLVQRLVEMHGGSIEIQSVPGQGSRFTVALPCLPTDSITEAVESTFQSKFHYALIIEDEAMDAGHLARYCRALGINPILHSTGKDALERAVEAHPNVIFLDIHLPDVSGWDVLAQLKANPETQHIPVVITSVDDEKQKAHELKADGYLVKFFAVSELRTALADIQKSISISEVSNAPSDRPTATVIIVDDNQINIETVVDYLSSKNFNVVSSQSGVDFLSRVPQLHPDIVLMDIQMPELDGLETIRRLRSMSDQRLASLPVVALTALAMPGDRELCIEAGADEYVTKPFRLKEIHALITQMLEDKKRTE